MTVSRRGRPEPGDTWEYTAPAGVGIVSGARARVWLHERHESGAEVWYYEWSYSDGSGRELDWAPSYRKAAELASLCFFQTTAATQLKVRFKKVPNGGQHG